MLKYAMYLLGGKDNIEVCIYFDFKGEVSVRTTGRRGDVLLDLKGKVPVGLKIVLPLSSFTYML